MPAKMARSAPRSPFGLPEATAVVRAASLSCQNEGKAPKFSRNRESSGESRSKETWVPEGDPGTITATNLYHMISSDGLINAGAPGPLDPTVQMRRPGDPV